MSMRPDPPDPRLPVVVGEADGPTDAAYLLEGSGAAPAEAAPLARFVPDGASHLAGCRCCGGRSGAARALDALFLARARGEAKLFGVVVALVQTDAGRDALVAALEEDRVVRARFRLVRTDAVEGA